MEGSKAEKVSQNRPRQSHQAGAGGWLGLPSSLPGTRHGLVTWPAPRLGGWKTNSISVSHGRRRPRGPRRPGRRTLSTVEEVSKHRPRSKKGSRQTCLFYVLLHATYPRGTNVLRKKAEIWRGILAVKKADAKRPGLPIVPKPKPDDVLFLLLLQKAFQTRSPKPAAPLVTEATLAFLPWDLTPRDLAQHELVNTVILSSP